MSELTQILVERLQNKGMEPSIMPAFIRDLATTILINPAMGYLAVNRHLHLLGWADFELDYHTLQLAIAYFEAEGLAIAEDSPKRLPEITSKFHKVDPEYQLSSPITS